MSLISAGSISLDSTFNCPCSYKVSSVVDPDPHSFWSAGSGSIKVGKNDPQKTKIEETYSFQMPDFLFGAQGPYSDPDPELDPH